jgi:dihydroorotate dehydrogenase electron transfer subunit
MCVSGVNDHKVFVKEIKLLTPSIVSMWCKAPSFNFLPGQFLMLEVPGFSLRRPFVIVDKKDTDIRVIFKIRGKGTAFLSKIKEGTELKALGPLGNVFPELPKTHTPLLIGGGIGIVTLLPLAKKLSENCSVTVALGADTKESLILLDEFSSCSNVITCTDDGTQGSQCNVVALIKKYLEQNKTNPVIYACGPTPMLRALSEFSKKQNLLCYVSLEERMGCGVGACVCCVVRTKDGLKRVCKDGPVFDSKELMWEF